jgi:hypothetical protein
MKRRFSTSALPGCYCTGSPEGFVLRSDKVKLELYLHRLLPIVPSWPRLAPGLSVWKLIRARAVAKTITEYGPLPEIHIPTIDYITLAIVIMLFIAALLEAIASELRRRLFWLQQPVFGFTTSPRFASPIGGASTPAGAYLTVQK